MVWADLARSLPDGRPTHRRRITPETLARLVKLCIPMPKPPTPHRPPHAAPARLAAILAALVSLAAAGADGAIAVRGSLETAAGTPAAGVHVELLPLLAEQERAVLRLEGRLDAEPVAFARTGADGRFRLDAPAEGVWKVVVRAEGAVPLETPLAPLLEPVVLPAARLVLAESLAVRVADPSGSPVPGALVELRRDAPSAAWSQAQRRGWSPAGSAAFSDARGAAILPVDERERPTAVASAPGWLPASGRGGEDTVELVVQPGVERILRVVGPAGEPVAGAVVRLGEHGAPVARTGDDGRATVALPAGGEVELALDAGGGWSFAAPLTLDDVAPGAEVPLLLPAPPRLVGRVVSAASSEPLPGAWVWPVADPGRAVRTDGVGVFTLAEGVESVLSLGGAAPGHRPATLEATVGGERPELALPPDAAVAGVVVDPTGRPVAEAEVAARATDRIDSSWEMDRSPRSHAVTDAEGRFRIGGVEPGGSRELRVVAEGYAPAERIATAGEPVRIALARGAEVTGRVFDAHGTPAGGAEANLYRLPEGGAMRLETVDGERVSDAEAVAGADGRFAVRHVPPGVYDLRVVAPGWAPHDLPSLEVADGGVVDVGRIDLAPAARIAGRVVDPEGEPVAGATVAVDRFAYLTSRVSRVSRVSSGNPRGVTTDAEGRFSVGGLAPGLAVDLHVSTQGFRWKQVSGVVPPTEEPITIELPRGVRVHGTVVDAAGAPVPRAVVESRIEIETTGPGSASRGMSSTTTIADQEGRFDATGLQPGSLTLTVREPGGGEGGVVLARTVEEGDVLGPLRLELVAGPAIEGTVLTGEGAPAVGVPVSLVRSWSREGGTGSTRAETTTDARGEFRFSGIETGPSTLRAEGIGGVVAARDVVVGEEDVRVELRLEPSREPVIVGRVVTPEGRPLAAARVTLAGPVVEGEVAPRSEWTDQGGAFRFDRLEPGRYRLTVTADAFAPPATPLEVAADEGEIETVELRLRRGARVEGEIVGLVPGEGSRFGVSARPLEGAGGEDSWSRHKAGRVDHAGRYAVHGLTEGRWEVVARDAQSGLTARATVEIGSELGDERLDLELPGGLTLSGRVLINGEGAPGLTLSLSGDPEGSGRPPVEARVGTRYDGGFRFAGLPVGTYRLALGSDYSREVELRVDREIAVELTAVRVAGRVLDAQGLPVGGATVDLRRENLSPREGRGVTTGADGRFIFPTVLPGRYRLEASAAAGTAATSLAVDRLDVERLELVLRP